LEGLIDYPPEINYHYKLKCIAPHDDGTIDYIDAKNVQKYHWAEQIIIYLKIFNELRL